MLVHSRGLASCIIVVSWAQAALAIEALPANPMAASLDVKRLVEQLDEPNFADRQAASQRLSEAGSAAFAELEHAAATGSREASGRAIDILRLHFERGDDNVKQAARSVLERLAKGDDPRSAQLAGEALNPSKPPAAAVGGVFGAPAVRLANIRVAARPAINVRVNGRRVHVRTGGGTKEITVEENGKKTYIREQAGQPIKLEITETKDGKETVEKFEVKDLQELKTKHADAHKMYEQYSAGAGGIRINVGIPAAGGNPVPVIPATGNPAAAAAAEAARDAAAAAHAARVGDARQRMVQNLQKQIDQMKARAPADPNTQRMVEALERSKQRIQQLPPPIVPPVVPPPALPPR
jgi:S-adenosylhomocysteine hydrolase